MLPDFARYAVRLDGVTGDIAGSALAGGHDDRILPGLTGDVTGER